MKKKMFDGTVTVLENLKVNGKYYKLTFRAPALARHVLPGQFLQMRVQEGHDPFLRRPFSFYRASQDRIEVLYEVLGYGTRILCRRKRGETVKVMGPLGKGFAEKIGKKRRVLVAGGVGVPPLVFLAERYPTDHLLIGTKSRAEILPQAELKKVQAKILYATEDGSFGRKGLVTGLLEEILKQKDPRELFIQTCGPKRMMEAVIRLARKYRIQGEASWDETMACGVGACLGCMVKTRDGLKRACADGPVFRFEDLDL